MDCSWLQYRFTNGAFNVPDVFFALSLMMLPRLSMANFFVFAVEFVSETIVASKRVDAFLKIPEPPPASHASKSEANGSVHLHDGNYGWYGQKDEKKVKSQQSSFLRILSKVPFTVIMVC